MAELHLRDYQHKIVSDIYEAWATGDQRVVVALPTGGGKTEIACALAKAAQDAGGRVLFIVGSKTLARQAAARFAKYGMTVSILRGEDTFVRHYAPVTVASIQTLKRREKHPDVTLTLAQTSLVIVDEAHIRHKAHDEVLLRLGSTRAVGLTATPLRDGLALFYQSLIRGPSYEDMIEAGHLVRPRYFLPTPDAFARALRGVRVVSTGDFDQRGLSVLMREKVIVGDLVETWQEKASDRPTIVFCVDKAHAKEITDAFLAAGVSTGYVDDKTKQDERAQIFRSFRNGELRVLVSIDVLSVGFDEPAAACAVLARPTLSLSLHVQQVGRVLRPHDGKQDCVILDHAGNVMRHGRIEDFRPPELSDIDKHSDRKKRTEGESDYRPCPECKALMSPKQRVCGECGHELARPSNVVVIRGDLVEDGRGDDRATVEEMQLLYLELRYINQERGKDPEAAARQAYAQLIGNCNYKAPIAWRRLDPVPPRSATVRLVKSWAIAYRKRMEAERGRTASR